MVRSAFSICCSCQLVLATGSFSEHRPLYSVSTLLIGEMLEVARYGPHGGKLHLVYRGWWGYSTWRKKNLHFDHHYIGNSNANHITLHDVYCMFHVRSWGCFEKNISRRPFRQRICCLYITNRRFSHSLTLIHTSEQTHIIGPTRCKLQDGWKPLQPAAKRSMIHLV